MTNNTETQTICGLRRENFQTTVNGKKTDLFILKNSEGNEVAITNYGGAIVAIMVPDKNGVRANVIQGHDNIQDVINSPEPYLSTLIGRYGNRICKGRFQLHGKEYQLPINNGPNSLHGGNKGFNAKVWDALQMNDQTLVLKYVSPYGEEGFSGEVRVTVIYQFNNDNELNIEYMATTNKKTIINLTNHGFFSLAGIADPTPTIDDIECQINADYYLPIDTTSIPTGEIRLVKDTPFDFRTVKPLGQDIDSDNEQIKIGHGYDHCYVLNKKEEGELSFAAKIKDPKSGRTMEVFTTEPGVQLYTDNWADGYKGQNGATFPRRSAVCFECQHFPDTPNHPYFPSVVLNPGQEYRQRTFYRFGVEK
ncbi:MAG: aldose epimerase family protein [Prevotella sp.]